MSETMDEQKRLNPQIMEVDVGIRELRKIKIYPLSMGDQLELTDLISAALTAQFARDDWSDIEIVSFIVNLINENLGKVLDMITDEGGQALIKDISNVQAAEIAEAIYTVNYESIAKNLKSLSGKVSKLFVSERPLPASASGTDTGLNPSTESTSKTEESLSDS